MQVARSRQPSSTWISTSNSRRTTLRWPPWTVTLSRSSSPYSCALHSFHGRTVAAFLPTMRPIIAVVVALFSSISGSHERERNTSMLIPLMRRGTTETSMVLKMSSIHLFKSFISRSFSSRLYTSPPGGDCTFFSKSISLCAFAYVHSESKRLPLLLDLATKLFHDNIKVKATYFTEKPLVSLFQHNRVNPLILNSTIPYTASNFNHKE